MASPPYHAQPSPEEQAFLRGYDPANFDHPSVAVDLVLLTIMNEALHALLIRRHEHPFSGSWSLPGGFVQIKESLEAAAERVLQEKAGLTRIFLEQLYTFGEPDRDPRTRIISVAHMALIDGGRIQAAHGAKNPAVFLLLDRLNARVAKSRESQGEGPSEKA